MFSASSFNALLKTLEEPPPHVKFILATTDPQKVPVTVLSRCLQFNLKRLSREQIETQLRHILQQERIPYDDESLSLLARGADGSMRDGLSLLDQAIAFGGGQVEGAEVRTMIGTVGADQVYGLLDALTAQDGKVLLQGVAEMSQLATDFTTATQELLAMLHQIALLQLVPDCQTDEAFDSQRLAQFAQHLAPEDVQLFYQIGLMGQKELHLAPDPRSGFEMLLLRMLAFRPDGGEQSAGGQSRPTSGRASGSTSARPASISAASIQTSPPPAAAPMDRESRAAAGGGDPSQWDSFVADLKLGGIASQLASHCVFESWDGETLSLLLDQAHRQLRVGQAEARLQAGIGQALGKAVKLRITEAVPESETPAMRQVREQRERQRQAQSEMANDPLVRELEEHFSARLVSDSVRPLD
jgi:DNA polymerase-3 subunit gamma/tau